MLLVKCFYLIRRAVDDALSWIEEILLQRRELFLTPVDSLELLIGESIVTTRWSTKVSTLSESVVAPVATRSVVANARSPAMTSFVLRFLDVPKTKRNEINCLRCDVMFSASK